MKKMKSWMVAILAMMLYPAYGQGNKQFITDPLPITKESGWNKVLCMKNGMTVLLHFEIDKGITVTTFDSLHHQTGCNTETYQVLDITKIAALYFEGLYDINGEAVLFLTQEYLGKHQLVRIQYDPTTGRKTNEVAVKTSPGAANRISFTVTHSKDLENYAIFYYMDVLRGAKTNELSVEWFNNKHEVIKEIKLPIDRKNFDYCDDVSAELRKEGLLVTLSLAKTVTEGTLGRYAPYSQNSGVYEEYLDFIFLPVDGGAPLPILIKSVPNLLPVYSLFTYNLFANTSNNLVYFYKPYNYGLSETGYNTANVFIKLDEQDRTAGFNHINNTLANSSLQKHTDTLNRFLGLPQKMFTEGTGLTTLVSSSYRQFGEPETRVKYNFQDYIGNIAVTQLDDDGNELWGEVLPMAQYFKSYTHYYLELYRSTWWQAQIIFGDQPEQVYNRQFVYFNTLQKGHDLYIIYNDYDKNFNNTIEHPGDTVRDFWFTNACYYKINRKHEITKNYLFGKSAENEYKCSFIESADFDERRGTYATLVQYKHGDDVSLRMAWVTLD